MERGAILGKLRPAHQACTLALPTVKSPYSSRVSLKNKNFRKLDLVQRRKKLTRLGTIGLLLAPDQPTEIKLLDKMTEWHFERFADSTDAYRQRQRGYKTFFEKLCAELLPTDQLCIWALTLNQEPIAVELLFRENQGLASYFQSFDPDYKSFSPGALLSQDVLNWWLAETKLEEFDFLRGEYEFKTRFATASRQNYNLILTRYPAERYFVHLVHGLRQKAKRFSMLRTFYRRYKKI